jgi:hypothetical protein
LIETAWFVSGSHCEGILDVAGGPGTEGACVSE